MIQGDNPDQHADSEDGDDSGEDFMALSANAVQGTESGKTVRMIADLYGQEVVILIDSSSSNNFVSEFVASKLW
jgi:hypothetical protein